MVTPTKTYSSNPFVDNVIYYGKLMAMNCTIKDEEEALANETKESLYAGDVLIACVEGTATYEMFNKIPQEILEKYIPISSNLDMYVQSSDTLKGRLESYGVLEKNMITNRLSSLARIVYIDHYETMSNYITDIAGTDWLIRNEALYNKCISGTATYNDLFDEMPIRTNLRIIRAYLNFYGYLNLAILWDPDSKITQADVATVEAKIRENESSVSTYDGSIRTQLMDQSYLEAAPDYNSSSSTQLNQLRAYIASRSDSSITSELAKISKAMREVFISHYKIMEEREYFSSKNSEASVLEGHSDLPAWMDYFFDRETYEKCKAGTASWMNLYNLFPTYALRDALESVLGASVVNDYRLLTDSDTLEIYFSNPEYCGDNGIEDQLRLNAYMIDVYMKNYQLYLNKSVYFDCLNEDMDIYDLYEYLPKETLKMIIDSEIPEVTNIQTYAESKLLLNSYLNTLPTDQAETIKHCITKDMLDWYPDNHIETNNYYRSLIGLPPMDKNGNVYEDTLIHTYDATTASFIEFGNQYISQAPTAIYPIQHWRKELYKLDAYDISVLNEYGIIEDYAAGCGATLSDPRYRYLRYLGDDKLNLYECRKAMNFDLIGMPPVDDTDIRKKFVDSYVVNQDYILRTVYSDAYKFQSDYYNKFIIIFIIVNTIMDLVTGIPDYIINRDVFDARCIKYLFESFGIPYYSEIPIKYQQAMLKNLNRLIKYKSSTKNMVDICNLFGFSDAKVFNYYLMKDYNVDASTGDFIFNRNDNILEFEIDDVYTTQPDGPIIDAATGEHFIRLAESDIYDEEKFYTKSISIQQDDGTITTKKILDTDKKGLYIFDATLDQMVPIKDAIYFKMTNADTTPASLKFVKVPLNESIIDYKNDDNYIIPYDEVTQEPTWDGGLDHDYLKNKILDYNFNAVKSKYISIEAVTDLTEMAFQTSYFYNMLFDNLYSEDLISMDIPSIRQNHKFRLTDVICFLFAMTYYYMGLEDNIMYSPTQILYVKGYNFNEALNAVLADDKFYDENHNNIFDINERIKDGYDYRVATSLSSDYPNMTDKGFDLTFDAPEYYVKGFNLEVDIDELEAWVNANFQMSLEDFVVSTDVDEFGDILTIRQFYSLNNSYYQKSIFNGLMTPTQYNNVIKYAYSFYLSKILYTNDIAYNSHAYINDDGNMRVIIPIADKIYVLDDSVYAYNDTTKAIPVYRVYKKSGLNYALDTQMYYVKNALGEYVTIVDDTSGNIYIKNEYGYIFSANNVYILKNGQYERINIQDPNRIYVDNTGRHVLNFGDYYIEQDGQLILNPDNCYVYATIDGNTDYVLLKSLNTDIVNVITDSDCYLVDEDGHYTKFEYTDYYIRTHIDVEQSNQMKYQEQDLFVISSEETEYYDESVTPRVYYRKLKDYYIEDENIVYSDVLYVKTPDGNYIAEDGIVSPANCWYIHKQYKDDDGNTVNEYRLVTSNLYSYAEYNSTIASNTILVLSATYDYYKYSLNNTTYTEVSTGSKKYIMNSDYEYITVIDSSKAYNNTKNLMVILNRAMLSNTQADDTALTEYNPSMTDKVWDENDWFYSEGENTLGMSGEDMWYYKDPNQEETETTTEEETAQEAVGSGWYLSAEQFIGNTSLTTGKDYYLAMDIECNFDGAIQIYITADDGTSTNVERIYNVRANEKQHVAQVFKANSDIRPNIRFIKYNFDNNPIHTGDYIVVSNLRISISNNDNYIPDDIPSIRELQDIYKTNRTIYKYLATQMRNTSSKKMYDIYKKLYDSLMICKYNKEVFRLSDNTYAKTYTEFLRSRDETLYDRLEYVKSLDTENMKKEITDSIIEVSYALDSLLTEDGLQYIYSYFPAVGASFIQQYISKVINWFKSWKVHLLGINSVYRFGNGVITDANGNIIAEISGDEFMVKILYDEKFDIELTERLKDAFVTGVLKIDINTTMPDHVGIRDRIRVITRNSNAIAFTDDQQNMHIRLTDDTSTITVKNGNALSIKTINGDEFKTVNSNQLLMTTDEDPENIFISQFIDEINLLSGDYIDYDELEEDDDE